MGFVSTLGMPLAFNAVKTIVQLLLKMAFKPFKRRGRENRSVTVGCSIITLHEYPEYRC